MFLEKDLQQEDYLQGRMQGNPYSSKEQGLGPLMRDIKNKICIGRFFDALPCTTRQHGKISTF